MKILILMISFILILDSKRLKRKEKGNEFLLPMTLACFLLFIESFDQYVIIQIIRIFFYSTFLLYIYMQIWIQNKHVEINANQIVILGCGLLEGKRISPMLMKRCDEAILIYQKYHNIMIVSGGKGRNEAISEASAMKEYLIQKGVDEQFIICEEKSMNTWNNIIESKKLTKHTIQIISSDFHLLRIYMMCKRLKINVQFIKSKSVSYYKIYAYIREYFAILYFLKCR